MSESVLLFTPVTLQSRHHLAMTDVALSHLSVGDCVTVLSCEGDLLNCPPNPAHELDRCRECRLQSQHALSRVLGPQVRQIRLELTVPEDLPDLHGIQDLIEFQREGVALGLFAARELINEERDLLADQFTPSERERATVLLRNCVGLFEAGRRLFSAESFDRVIVTNGRHDSDGPLVAAAQLHGIPTDAVEAARDDVRILRIRDAASVHNLLHRADRVAAAAARLVDGDDQMSMEGHSFFEQQRSGRLEMRDWRLFHRGDEPDPRIEVVPGTGILAVYSHSDWEYWGMDQHATRVDYIESSAIDQYGRIEGMLESAAIRSRFTVVVRWHPNLREAGPRIAERRRLLESRFHDERGVQFIRPEDEVSSYGLLDMADAVVTFGSTIGIEATYWGKPSILYGTSAYAASGCFHGADSVRDVESILERSLPAKPRMTALAAAWIIQDLDLPKVRHFERQNGMWQLIEGGTPFRPQERRWRLRRRMGNSKPRGR